MKILVCGGRDFKNYNLLKKVLDNYYEIKGLTIIHGGAKGADSLAGEWAKRNDVFLKIFPADWKQFGKSAGPKRNQKMIEEGKPDLVIAFPGGNGTADMIRRARRSNIPVKEINDEYFQIFDEETS